ncbi:hypothetical protein [Streptomyces niveus]|uniref:hypothetical protein n=1 Tax=Streptomyces niveus TaxID=193462 RepID=UPI00341E4FD8
MSMLLLAFDLTILDVALPTTAGQLVVAALLPNRRHDQKPTGESRGTGANVVSPPADARQ